MNKPVKHKIRFEELRAFRTLASSFHEMHDAYICASVDNAADMAKSFDGYTHISGISICMVRHGSFIGTIGLESFQANEKSIIVLNSSQLFNIQEFTSSPVSLDLVFIAPELLHDINIDPNSLDLEAMLNYKPSPVYQNLDPDIWENFNAYFTLLRNNTNPNIEVAFAKNIARSLIQAIFYQMFQLHSHDRENNLARNHASKNSSLNYVHDFMMLLQLHHMHQRSISFYADKMFVSPKYLSALIKKATGRSAAEWIDQFVINEAKNMLRFSNKNIQQVAIALNFSTQSAFGKYFKHLTGMSPSEYQKT